MQEKMRSLIRIIYYSPKTLPVLECSARLSRNNNRILTYQVNQIRLLIPAQQSKTFDELKDIPLSVLEQCDGAPQCSDVNLIDLLGLKTGAGWVYKGVGKISKNNRNCKITVKYW